MSDVINFLKKRLAAIVPAFLVLWAFLPSLGTGFQNATAIIELLNGVNNATNWLIGSAILGGAVVGGICSTLVNYCLNYNLLKDFWERISGRKSFAPYFSDNGKKFRYVVGVVVFVVTGILFGLTALSVGATGGLAIAAIVAGVFVALVTIPQELETWLESFDEPVAVAIGKRIYDINQLENTESEAKILGFLTDLQKEIKYAILKKELKELRKRLTQQAEIESIDRVLLYLEKNEIDLDELITRCLGKDSLSAGLENIQTIIEREQTKIASLITHFKQQDKNAIREQTEKDQLKALVITELTKLKKAAEEDQPQIGLIDAIKIWWRDLTPGRFIGLIISLGNVLALSLLFTIGLTTFLTTVGVAALPALIIGFSVAFTFGAFTEFYFYHYFLADFCNHIAYKWKELMNSPNWGLGIATVVTNAAVNGVLAYFGVILLGSLLAAAGIAAPPLLILAVVSAVLAGVASLLLGSNFWIDSAAQFAKFFTFNWGSAETPAEENMAEDISENKTLLINDVEVKIKTSQKTWNWIFPPVKENNLKDSTLNGAYTHLPIQEIF